MIVTNKKWQLIFIYCLAALVILGFIGVIVVLIFHLAPESNNTLLNVLAGAFATMTIQIVNYFYGSSKSSADKNEMIYNSTPLIGGPPTDKVSAVADAIKAAAVNQDQAK